MPPPPPTLGRLSFATHVHSPRLLGTFPQPRELDIEARGTEWDLARSLRHATRLERLTLHVKWLRLELAQAVATLPRLQHLSLEMEPAEHPLEGPRVPQVEGDALEHLPASLRDLRFHASAESTFAADLAALEQAAASSTALEGLTQLHLRVHTLSRPLAAAVGRLTQLQRVVLVLEDPRGAEEVHLGRLDPGALPLVPCLRSLSIDDAMPADLEEINLAACGSSGSLDGLTWLDFNVLWEPEQPPPDIPPLRGLATLPALETLNVEHVLPEIWRCRSLTSLGVFDAELAADDDLIEVDLPNLCALRFAGVSLLSGTLAPALFASATGLTKLSLDGIEGSEWGAQRLLTLPPTLSALHHLVEFSLCVADGKLAPRSLAAMQSLGCLRKLRLHRCGLDGLPGGPWLEGLTSLDITFNDFSPSLPFVGGHGGLA